MEIVSHDVIQKLNDMKNVYKTPFKIMVKPAILMLTGLFMILFSCKKDNDNIGMPVISKITRTSPESIAKDSTFTQSFPGTMIIIHGENFNDLKKVYFNGKDTYFNMNYTTNRSIVITIPADAPTLATDPEAPDLIRVVTGHGETTFSFKLLVEAPIIYSVSNEFAKAGTQITLYGKRFFQIEKVMFPGGLEGTEMSIKGDSLIMVKVPANLTTGGSLIISNEFGADTVSFQNKANMISNFDEVNNYSWGATAIQDNPAPYPGNNGQYAVMQFANVSPGNFSWWEGGRSVNLNPSQQIPQAELSNSINDYVMKFEIYVKEPWSAGTLMIQPQGSWTYINLYRPWKISATSTKAFVTEGWRTVTVPLNMFLTKENNLDGTGDPAPNLAALLGATGNSALNFIFVNDGVTEVAKFDIAIDNIRIEKIN